MDFEKCGRYGIATYGTIFGRDDIATYGTGWWCFVASTPSR